MNDEAKKRRIAKGLVKLRSQEDVLWAKARNDRARIQQVATKRGPLTQEDINVLRLCAGIVLSKLLVNATEVEASKYLTPEEEDEYGGTNP